MYNYLILISDDSDFSMAAFEDSLQAFYGRTEQKRTVGIERIGDEITVVINKFPFFLVLNGGDTVREEAGEIADHWKGDPAVRAKIANCSRRVEMHAEGQDFNMDYFNDSLYIIGEIEEFSGVYIFDPAQGSFA